ncbi:MAG: hypothetical protein K2X39_05890 [Silvanigrellaceae bacterium]|nr:hypothetical protein [Silvanigrellaceae bacterium]
MIKGFSLENLSSQDFVNKVTSAIQGRELGKIVSLKIENNQMLVLFSKLGKSEVVYDIISQGSGFKCVFKSEKIALTHKPLRSTIEGKLEQIFVSQGAKIQQN